MMTSPTTNQDDDNVVVAVNNDEEALRPHDKQDDSKTPTTVVLAPIPWYILPLLVFSQFAGTSLWFAGNAVLADIADDWDLPDSSRGVLTSAVQLGFIIGSLVSAVTQLPDRVRPPTRVFAAAAWLGAFFNALIVLVANDFAGLLVLRFATGCTLAGIYPVGMKVAAEWYTPQRGGLGHGLGYLVGALVLGTAVPFVLRVLPQSWQALLWETSSLAATGGTLLATFGVPPPKETAAVSTATSTVQEEAPAAAAAAEEPATPTKKPEAARKNNNLAWDLATLRTLFVCPEFRAAAFGYWNHMWELYAFWTWLPVVWKALLADSSSNYNWNADTITFVVIAVGSVGCVGGGYLSERWGSALVATTSLAVSGVCCLLSPLLYHIGTAATSSWGLPLVLVFYLVWGTTVVADSPQFSTLVATTAPPALQGTALTLVNSVGFSITIGSIQLLGAPVWSEQFLYWWLAPGPLLGVLAMYQGFFRNHEATLDPLPKENPHVEYGADNEKLDKD